MPSAGIQTNSCGYGSTFRWLSGVNQNRVFSFILFSPLKLEEKSVLIQTVFTCAPKVGFQFLTAPCLPVVWWMLSSTAMWEINSQCNIWMTATLASGREGGKKSWKHQGDVWYVLACQEEQRPCVHCQCQKHAWTGLYGSVLLTARPLPHLYSYSKGAPLPQESTVINASCSMLTQASCLITQRIWVIWKGPIYMAASLLDRNPVFRAGQRFKYRLLSKINSRLHTTESSVTVQACLFVWGLST